MRFVILFLILIIILLGLMGCSTNKKDVEYNPLITIVRISTGNFK